MTPEEVARACDELHEFIESGPGGSTAIFTRALNIVRRLRFSAPWDYPLNLLDEIETQLGVWFNKWQGTDDEDSFRNALLERISRLEDAWDRPRA